MNTYFAFGDAPFFFQEQLKEISWLPSVWDGAHGLGNGVIAQLWIDYPIRLFIKLAYVMGLNWWSIDKMLWVSAVIMSVVSIWKLSRYIFQSRFISTLSVIIYSLNTYVLMLFDGGQRGVMLAYSFAPYVVYRFISSIDEIFRTQRLQYLRNIQNGVIFAILIAFDLRLAYLVGWILIAYCIFSMFFSNFPKNKLTLLVVILGITLGTSLFISLLVHAYWILPMLFVHDGLMLAEEYTSAGMLKFLSVADFSHALSLLHPNWPENLFGKVYFLQPEFLLIPVVGFSSLLFGSWIKDRGSWIETQGSRIKDHGSWIKDNQSHPKSKIQNPTSNIQYPVSFFLLLVLVGAFFAKGVQQPFGGIFEWMFEHIPGFVMFRDPTKFYLYIALGYSMVIPVALNGLWIMDHGSWIDRTRSWIMNRAGLKNKSRLQHPISIIQYPIAILFIVFWLFTIRPVFLGTLSGNFRPKAVSSDYIRLKDVLVRDANPSRVLWLPSAEKFSYASDIHPIISSEVLLKTSSVSGMLKKIHSSDFQQLLYVAGVKYVVIPIDIWKRMFLVDYKFAPEEREKLMISLLNTSIIRVAGFSELVVFENTSFDFKAPIPEYVIRQEYFMRIGLVMSACSLFVMVGILVKYRKKQS